MGDGTPAQTDQHSVDAPVELHETAEDREAYERERHHYADAHHGFSLIESIGERVDHALEQELFQRDPAFVARLMPVLDRLLTWFDPEVRDFENIPPDGPCLLVGNHSGFMYIPDYWALLRRWVAERGPESPLYAMTYDVLFSIPGASDLARRVGAVPASRANANRLLDAGMPLIVYPGGDAAAMRPWTQRNRVDLEGRTGFVKLALRHGVPVVPFVGHGSHDVVIVVATQQQLAHHLGLDRFRVTAWPLFVGAPFGISSPLLPTVPLPAKVTVRVGEPIDWSRHGPEAADDPDIVRHCYEEVLGRMQADLDDLAAEIPHPIATRAASAVRSVTASLVGTGRSLIGLGNEAGRPDEPPTGATPDPEEQ
jgi:1-acyl-sn-glycerol-3-phosphate acyltransferase